MSAVGMPGSDLTAVSSKLPVRESLIDLVMHAFVQGNPWLKFLILAVLIQTAHFLEHLLQVTQIHLLGIPGPRAQGLLGAALNTEWLHFAFNSGLIAAIAFLLVKYRNNRWLWLTAAFALWHEAEHLYIIRIYLESGISGTPGLLARGGAIGGGLSLSRPDLHFFYNLIESVLLAVALAAEFRRFSASQLPWGSDA